MTNTEKFVRDAVEAGWKFKNNPEMNFDDPIFEDNGRFQFVSENGPNIDLVSPEEILSDPDAWRAVAKVHDWATDGGRCVRRLCVAKEVARSPNGSTAHLLVSN
jgi:hypothetical protein